jgi:peptidoglycan/LPS O-acetylase OafA/YrhL
LYLWHWPVFVYTRPGLDWQLNGWASIAARLAITVALTEASYQLVERPIRERGFATYVREGPQLHLPRPRPRRPSRRRSTPNPGTRPLIT